MQYYKFLMPDGATPQGYGRWPLDGSWMPKLSGKLIPCERGYHVMSDVDLIEWCGPYDLWTVETKYKPVPHDNKTVVRTARLVDKVGSLDDRKLRLFAADCAEWVLPLFEAERPDDDRPRKAIEAARAFANGEITAAAWDAARAAAWDAARAAARDAARAAARDATWDAARDAERQWQTARLLTYVKENQP
ncbi:MAG: putative immunity protein [Candidatus Nanopelagicales bacterium]